MDLYSSASLYTSASRLSPNSRRAAVGHTTSLTSSCSASDLRRGIRIEELSHARSGVWYYQVDIAVYAADSNNSSTFDYTGSGDESDISGYASPRCSLLGPGAPETDVLQYSVLRRYNDFLHLYEQVKLHLATEGLVNDLTALPAFPDKELISPSVFGILWRMSSPVHVLQDRKAKFQKLLQYIEHHGVARQCPAFADFLGQPPQRQDGGYVSLKEYTSQNWFASFKQIAKDKEQRKRHYTMDSERLSELLDQTRIKSPAAPSRLHAQQQQHQQQHQQSVHTAHERTQYALLGKRRRRAKANSSSSIASINATNAVRAAEEAESMQRLVLSARREAAAQVGGSRPLFKKSKSFHHALQDDDNAAVAAVVPMSVAVRV